MKALDVLLASFLALATIHTAQAYRTPKLTDKIVGVVPFVWVATPGKPLSDPTGHPVTNITKSQVKALLVNNTLKLKSLTGDASDTEAVQGVGRDENSGTRIQALACAGIGVETALKQYQPLYNGAATPVVPQLAPGTQITGAALWPAVTLNAISYPQADSGYNSVTILEGSGAAGFTAQYLYWGHEHIFYRTTFGGNGLIVAGQLVSDLTTTSAGVSGILLSGMKVSRGQRWWRNRDEWQTRQLTFDRQSVKPGFI